MTSCVTVAQYRAALPYPGHQSVPARSLSIVLGTPYTPSEWPRDRAARSSRDSVSIESFPPQYTNHSTPRRANVSSTPRSSSGSRRLRQLPNAAAGVSANASRSDAVNAVRSTTSPRRAPSMPCRSPRTRTYGCPKPEATRSRTPARLALMTGVGPPDWPTSKVGTLVPLLITQFAPARQGRRGPGPAANLSQAIRCTSTPHRC